MNSGKEGASESFISAYFEIPKYSDNVSYEFWLTNADKQSTDLINNFYSYFYKFKDVALFQPHYYHWLC